MPLYKRTAIFMSIVMGLGIIIDLVFLLTLSTEKDTHVTLLYMLSLSIFGILSLLCLLPAFEKAKIVHPIIFFSMSLICMFDNPFHSYAYLFAMLFVVWIFRYGYMQTRFRVKLVCMVSFFLFCYSFSVALQPTIELHQIRDEIGSFFVQGAVLFCLYQAFREKIRSQSKQKVQIENILFGIEVTVARRIAEMQSLKEIANEIGKSYEMVRQIASNIYKKLGLSSKDEFMRFLGENDIIWSEKPLEEGMPAQLEAE